MLADKQYECNYKGSDFVMITYEIHTLWLLLLEMYKNDNTSVELDASAGELIIEE